MSANLRAALMALLAFALYATHDVFVKLLGASFAPFQIIFFSVLFGFPLATLKLIHDPAPGHLRPVHPWWTLLRTGAAVVTGICAFYAFSVLPLTQTYAILFAVPLIITLLSIPILGEQVGLRRWAAVIVGLGGVLVVLRPGATDLGLGHLAALAAAATSALASIIVRKIGRDERDVVLVLYPMLANFALMAVLLPLVYRPMTLHEVGLNAGLAAFGFVASLLIVAAYKAGEAVVVAPMQYSQIVWATLFGLLLFEEAPDGWTLAGAGIVIASGVYIVLRESRMPATTAPVLRSRARFETGTLPRLSALRRGRGKAPEKKRD
ncbi:DMT family transporter [Roseivivax sp. CAU 1761]